MISELTTCPFCQSNSVQKVDVNVNPFLICGQCAATFLGSDQLLQLDRKIFTSAKNKWRDELDRRPNPNSPTTCLLHSDKSLILKKIPGHNHQSFVSECCQLLHLSPSEMVKILKTTQNIGAEFKATYRVKSRWNPFKFIFDKFKSETTDDEFELEGLQYDRKIGPIFKGK